jgi:hypothetical protein
VVSPLTLGIRLAASVGRGWCETNRRAAEKRDELAPPHGTPLPQNQGSAPGVADARPNIPIALIQIDARIIMSSTLVCPVPTGCYPDGKWPNSLSPSGISKRDYVYDHVLATVAGTGT